MGWWDSIRGRKAPIAANLDSLFEVPSAAITLQTGLGLTPTGEASVCYRTAGGTAFATMQREVVELLQADPATPAVRLDTDSYGFTWLSVTGDPADTAGLCTDLHVVNTSLEEQGFGPGLLCTLIPFADSSGRRVGLVYLYKQGTYYAFAPTGPQQRDNLLELTVRDALADELPMEPDLARWMAVWDAPGL